MKTIIKKALLSSSIGLVSLGTLAATNPVAPTATSSTGDLIVNATVNALFRVSELTDITFPAYAGSGVWTAPTENFCVYTNGAGGAYRITLTGSTVSLANTFAVEQSPGVTINYNVAFTDGVATVDPVTSGTFENNGGTGFQGDPASPVCGGAGNTNASVTLSIAEVDAQAAAAGIYSGTLTFLVAAP